MAKKFLILFFCITCLGTAYQYFVFLHELNTIQQLGQTYQEKRILYEFRGLQMDLIEGRLNQLLPTNQSIALSPDIEKIDFLRQRLSEALYPRKISNSSPYIINFASGEVLSKVDSHQSLYLSGATQNAIAADDRGQPSVVDPPLPILLVNFLVLTIVIAALGKLILQKLGKEGPAESILMGALLVACAATASALLQIPIPRTFLPLIGALSTGYLAWKAYKNRTLSGSLKDHALDAIPLQGIAFACLLVFFGYSYLFLAELKWDARSIWFFHAKEIFYQGLYLKEDFARPEYQWSHPDYPLFIPSWIAYFNSLSPFFFSERIGILGIWALFAALASIIWRLAKSIYGSFPGSLVTLTLLLAVAPNCEGGLADGILFLLLATGFLAFRTGESGQNWLGWIALAAASMVKLEGLVLALVLAGLLGWRRKRTLLFLPSLIYFFWARSMHLHSDYSGIPWREIANSLIPRSLLILQFGLFFTKQTLFFLFGTTAFFIAAILGAKSRPGRPFIFSCFVYLFIFCAFLITPLDMRFHITTAMERLLLHAAGFSILALAEGVRLQNVSQPR